MSRFATATVAVEVEAAVKPTGRSSEPRWVLGSAAGPGVATPVPAAAAKRKAAARLAERQPLGRLEGDDDELDLFKTMIGAHLRGRGATPLR